MRSTGFKIGIVLSVIAAILGFHGTTGKAIVKREWQVQKAIEYLHEKPWIYYTPERGDTPWACYKGEDIPADAPPELWRAYASVVEPLEIGKPTKLPDIDEEGAVGPNANEIEEEKKQRQNYLDDLVKSDAGEIASVAKKGYDIYNNFGKPYQERMKTAYDFFKEAYQQAESATKQKGVPEYVKAECEKLQIFAGMHQALVLLKLYETGASNRWDYLKEALGIYETLLIKRGELTRQLGDSADSLETLPLDGLPVAEKETIRDRIDYCKRELAKK